MASFARWCAVAGLAAAAAVTPAALVSCDGAPQGPAASSGTASGTASSTGAGGGAGAGGGTGAVTGTGGSGAGAGTGGGAGGPGSGGSGGEPADAGDAGDAPMDVPVPCNTEITAHPVAASPHVPDCTPIAYATNPPTSGPHYPSWAAFATYATPVPRGYYVHSLEHGAIVITYNCAAPCDEELADLAAYLIARPADPLCAPPVHARIIVTPDPELDVRFAASAWGYSLRSNCFDLAFLDPFIDAHYAMTAEDFCGGGFDPTSPDAGVPPGCGQADGGDGG